MRLKKCTHITYIKQINNNINIIKCQVKLSPRYPTLSIFNHLT